PPPARADPRGSSLSRGAAALPDRHREGDLLGAGRRGEGEDPRAEGEPREAPGPTVQGPRRDEPGDAEGDDSRAGAPDLAPGDDRRRRRDRRDDLDSDGPRRRAALPTDHGPRR